MKFPPSFAVAGALSLLAIKVSAQIPQYDHVVILIEENKTYSEVIGNTNPATGAPYLNSVANTSVLFTNSHAIEHPSQPNYLDLYSGFNQGVIADFTSPLTPFSTANLGASLVSHGYSFADYSESLPFSLPSNRNMAVDSNTPGATAYGYTGDSYTAHPGLNEYQRKHNPVSNWQNDSSPGTNQLPSTTNQPFTAFPTDFTKLPTVSFVVPNEQDDMHDGTLNHGDAWALANIDLYRQWALTHNSLLIITWDENDDEDLQDPLGEGTNQIVTIFSGAHLLPGQYDEFIDHFDILRTLDDMYGLSPSGVGDLTARPITDVFSVPDSSPAKAGAAAILGLIACHFLLRRRRTRFSITLAVLLVVGLLAGAGRTACAGTIIVPNELPDPNSSGNLPASQTYGDTSNLFPFFSGAGNAIRYQQVYESSQFSSFSPNGEDITQIAFRVGSDAAVRLDHGAFSSLIPLIQFTLSTTSATPDGLSATLASNTGGDATVVYGIAGIGSPLVLSSQGSLMGDPAPFDIVVNLTTPFHYNPALGNLLLDIQNYSGAESLTGIELDGTMLEGDSVSRAYNFGAAKATGVSQSDGADNDTNTLGLVMEFVSTPGAAGIPDSGNTLCLGGIAISLIILGSFRVRRV